MAQALILQPVIAEAWVQSTSVHEVEMAQIFFYE